MNLPLERRTFSPLSVGGVGGGVKYRVRNILFKFAVDWKGVYGDEEDSADVRNVRAAKAAGHELGGLACWEQFAPSKFDGTQAFRLPLMCLVDYRGYRLLAISWISWLGPDTQIMGSNDGMHVLFNRRGGAAELHEHVGEAAARMKLRLHIAGRSPSVGMPNYDVWDGCRPVELWTAFDVEGHKSRDGQFYLLDFARTMPAQARLAPLLRDGRLHGRHWPQYEAKERLYRLLRPELVSSNDVPLSADCYSPLSYNTYKELNRLKELKTMIQDLQRATLRLCTRIVPAYARRLAIDVPAAFDSGVLSDYRLVQEMHRRGINLRFIGALLANVPPATELPGGERAASMARAFLLVEAVARVVKANLRQAMREANKRPLAEYDHVAIVDILNCVFGDSDQADTYARGVLEPHLARRFGVYLNNSDDGADALTLRGALEATDLPALHLLRTRIFQLTGISLAPGAPDTFGMALISEAESSLTAAASVFSDPYSHEKPFSDADLLFRETVKRSSGVVRAEAEALLTEAWTLMPYDQLRAEHLVRLAIRHVDEALDRMPSNAHLLADRAFAYERLLRLLSRRLRGTYGITGTFYSTENPLVRLTEYYFQLAIEANNINSKTLHHYARFLQHCGSFALSACYLWHAMRHANRLELLWNLAIKEYTTLALEARNNAPRNKSPDAAAWSRIRSDISRLCDRWRQAKQYLSLAEQTEIFNRFKSSQ